MKRILQSILWLFTLLLIIIVVKTFLFRSVQVQTEPVVIDGISEESITHLSDAVKFPTVSYSVDSPIDTSAFSDYLSFIKRTYPLINNRLEKEIFNNFSLLYLWKGTNSSLKPMVLLAHYDVVPPGDTASWERSPFSGDNDGTFIWGRGTMDDKASMISILEAVEQLLKEGYMPERTVYLSFGHDEEIGGERGAKTIVTALKDRGVSVEYVIDEGMAVSIGMVPMIKKPVALIGTSEKGYISVRMSVDMPGGHSSTPEKESAIIVLNRSVNNLAEKQMAPKISGPVDDFISYIGPEMPFYAKAVFANQWIFRGVLLGLYTGSSGGNALVRTTTAPTIFHAGIKDNVIPTKAEAVVNFRILTGETSMDVLDHITKVVNDERVKIEVLDGVASEPASVSPSDSPGFRFIFTTLRQIYPDAIVAPTLVLGATDSRHFSVITSNIYRFIPIIVTTGDMSRMHGLNERINAKDFKHGIGFYYQLIKNSQAVQ